MFKKVKKTNFIIKKILIILPVEFFLKEANKLKVKLFQFLNFTGESYPKNKRVIEKFEQRIAGKFKKGIDIAGGVEFVVTFNEEILKTGKFSADDIIRVLRDRIDSTGLLEAEIRKLGSNFIIIRVPFVSQTEIASIRKIITQPANLEFRGLDELQPTGQLRLEAIGNYENLSSYGENEN